jgi:hypothetical protein
MPRLQRPIPLHNGTILKALFTIMNGLRYAVVMVLLAAIIAATAPAASGMPSPVAAVQATATVRIISGVRLKLDSATNTDAPRAHDSVVTTSDGTAHPARLIEFQ